MKAAVRPQLDVPHNELVRNLPERRYRPELHGVRGLALLGVVLFHLFGAGRTSGGIDIFLAVTGFLFTGMLLREAAAAGGRIELHRYFGRLVRRILVPAAIVVVFTLVAGLLISPVTQHSQLWAEARASLLYFENIELINSQLAYGAAGPDTSPFQHFWSLSVQGQFYLLWPAIAVIAVLVAKALKTSAARVMAVLVGLIFVASIAYAIYVGGYDQDAAYLMSTTRAWELAFGGLLALAGGKIGLPAWLRMPVGWLGIVLIVTCGFVLDGAQLFPGPWALWPLAGLTLVLIAAGPNGGEQDPVWSASRFLSNKPLAWIGDHAYGLYLWHWPLLIFYLEIRDRNAVGIRGAFVILFVTLVLAVLMFRYVEKPLKDLQIKRSPQTSKRANRIVVTVAAGALILAGGGTAMVLQQQQVNTTVALEDWDWENYPGALAALDDDVEVPDVAPMPAVENAMDFRPDYVFWDCEQPMGDDPGTDEISVCEDPNNPEDPRARVVLAGGSHAGHWQNTFQNLAEQHNWELQIVTKSSCIFRDIDDLQHDMCASWQTNFMDWLQDEDVDLVVTPGSRMDPAAEPEYIQGDAPDRWAEIIRTDTDLLLLRGTPRHDIRVPECIAGGEDPTTCGPDVNQIADKNPLDEMNLAENIYTVDLNPYICPAAYGGDNENCSGVVGNVLVWYDRLHFTDAFADTLTPALETHLREEIPWLFS